MTLAICTFRKPIQCVLWEVDAWYWWIIFEQPAALEKESDGSLQVAGAAGVVHLLYYCCHLTALEL
jgi:hypothetical protein